MTDYAAVKLATSRDAIVGIAVEPDPTPETRDGQTILQVRSGGPNVLTLVTLRDGTVREVSMDCYGIPGLQCQDAPTLQAVSVTGGGYFDVPEGATPVPSPDADAVAAAVPLHVASLDIPLDHDGHYAVVVGRASLPNGILRGADFGFASSAWPSDFAIANGVVTLTVRSAVDPSVVVDNIYNHPRVRGAESVEGVLEFDVLHHLPGAVLSVRDIVVR